jgi:hypothetical protein
MDGAHIQVCHPVRMFPVITDVAYTSRESGGIMLFELSLVEKVFIASSKLELI